MKASSVIEILLLLDSLSARLVSAVKEILALGEEEDEQVLQEKLEELRANNDARFKEVVDLLKS